MIFLGYIDSSSEILRSEVLIFNAPGIALFCFLFSAFNHYLIYCSISSITTMPLKLLLLRSAITSQCLKPMGGPIFYFI